MKKREYAEVIYSIAEGQLGYFTAAQARAADLLPVRILQMVATGAIERTSRGVYRVSRFPVSRWGQYMEAALWPQVRRQGVVGVISHESALAFYGMSEVSPATVHITLPPSLRIRREVPKYISIHHADLAPHELLRMDGIPITSPERAVRDAAAAKIGSAIVRQAIADGRRNGQLLSATADRLAHDYLGDTFTPASKAKDQGPSDRENE